MPVGDPALLSVIDRTGWVASASDTTFGAASLAIDGSTSTQWESTNTVPQYLILDMLSPRTFTGISYLSRNDGFVDAAGAFQLFVSSDGSTWGSAIASGTFIMTTAVQYASFSSQTARYLKFNVTSAAAGSRGYISCADFNVGTYATLAAVAPSIRAPLTNAASGANHQRVKAPSAGGSSLFFNLGMDGGMNG